MCNYNSAHETKSKTFSKADPANKQRMDTDFTSKGTSHDPLKFYTCYETTSVSFKRQYSGSKYLSMNMANMNAKAPEALITGS